ncbi:MAG TPA: endonuclease MutS2, partial [Myxococcota bacterium]|nr:endonuclease MutS2 [Myxococcota bacterium]
LAQDIEAAIEPSGHIRDSASSTLAELRGRALQLHRDIKVRIEAFLHDPAFAPNLQDSYFSVRGDRYVLPINTSFRSKVPGIVHNASQTGQTVFIEPQEVVPLGNELAIAESLAAEEERRILAMFSAELGESSEALLGALERLGALDVTQAAAVLAQDMDASPATLAQAGEGLDLRGLRHPLLLLQRKAVVANRVTLDAEQYALVISGPNAGGKTVTLTGAGLCALMTRAGLPIPADPGSRLPLFMGVHCAVGDAQDLSRGLSSFSAHVEELKTIVEVGRNGWLILIDEIAADTDPQEGAAIARACLEDLVEKRARVLVTTHLEEIKALGVADPRFVNARVGFEPGTFKPTYALELGAAGISCALAMAAQVGLPERVLARARAHMAGTGLLSAALGKLQAQQREAEALHRELAAARDAVTDEREALARLRDEAETARREARVAVRAELAAEVEVARQEVSALIAKLQAQPSIRQGQVAQKELAERAAALQDEMRRHVARAEAP